MRRARKSKRKYSVEVERELTFKSLYTVVAANETEALEKAIVADEQVDLDSGEWSDVYRKAKVIAAIRALRGTP